MSDPGDIAPFGFRAAMKPHAVLVLITLLGCGPGSSSGSKPAPAISTKWASATAPDAFVPLTSSELERLRQSVVSTRPKSTVDIQGRKSTGGFASGTVWVMSAEHPELENTRGLSMRQIADGLRERATLESKERRITAPSGSDFRLTDVPDRNQIELNWTMRGPSGNVLENRARMGLRDDGVLLEAVCSCSEVGCARERCTLSLPPDGLLPVDARFEAPRADDELEILETQWAWVQVPKVYVPLSIAEEAQLPSKSVPGMKVEFKGRKHPEGAAGGLMYVRSVDHQPQHSYGRTLTEVVQETREIRVALDSGAPAEDQLAYTVHLDPEARVIELRGAPSEASKTRSQNRSVFTFLTDGTLREAECFCDAHVCLVQDCTLDVGDADRAKIDTPVFPGGAPKRVTLGEGAVTFEVPPFLEQLDDVEAAKADWVVDDTHLEGSDRICFGTQDAGDGFVCATERRWCSAGACTLEEVNGYAKTEAELLARELSSPSKTVKPSTSQGQRIQVHAGVQHSVREFSAKIGRTIWRRSVAWQAGDAVVERTCTCSGNPCRLMEKTCTIAEP